MDRLHHDTFVEKNYVSRSRKHEYRLETNDAENNYRAQTIYHGSRSSNSLIRIYDKAQQLGHLLDHWVRVELELHQENAFSFLAKPDDIGAKWAGILMNLFRYVEPDPDDSNRWRWPLTSYWQNLIGSAEAIKLNVAPGVPYNVQSLESFVFLQAGNSIRTYIELFGKEAFMKTLQETKPVFVPAKYTQLIETYLKHEKDKEEKT